MDHHPQSASVLLGCGRLYERKYTVGVLKQRGPYNSAHLRLHAIW